VTGGTDENCWGEEEGCILTKKAEGKGEEETRRGSKRKKRLVVDINPDHRRKRGWKEGGTNGPGE